MLTVTRLVKKTLKCFCCCLFNDIVKTGTNVVLFVVGINTVLYEMRDLSTGISYILRLKPIVEILRKVSLTIGLFHLLWILLSGWSANLCFVFLTVN